MRLIKKTEETYILTRDVVNPMPDRRYKRDWRMQPCWEKGTKFLITTELHDRTTEKKMLAAARSMADKLVAAGGNVPPESAVEIQILQKEVDSGPYKIVLLGMRGDSIHDITKKKQTQKSSMPS